MSERRLRFLVVGAGRGGTSLLMGLLDAHPGLGVGLERHTVECLMGHGLEVPAAGIKERLVYERSVRFRAACDADAERNPSLYWGNKVTTEQIYGLEDHNFCNPGEIDVVKTLFSEHLDDVFVIFILRDGRTCVRSKLQRTNQDLAHACARWRYSVRVMDYISRHHPQSIIIRYEDLVHDARSVLRRICEALDVEFEEQMLAGVSNEKLPEEYRNDQISRSGLSFKGVPALAFPLLMDELKRLGYISGFRYWLGRVTYSRWSIPLCLLLSLLGLVGLQIAFA